VSPTAQVTDLISAYHDSAWHKIAEHGSFTWGKNTHFLSKEVVLSTHLDSIYLFGIRDNDDFCKSYDPYILQENQKNFLDFPGRAILSIDKWQYPK
jgi:hypothetical protein